MNHKHVKTRREGRVLIATLDSPPHQLMTFDLVAELDQLVAEVEHDGSVGAVVLHGAHPERFLAHFDVGELLESGRASNVRLSHGQASLALHAVSAAARRESDLRISFGRWIIRTECYPPPRRA